MASPWAPTGHVPAERPWLGMAMLTAIPVFSLILVRLFWSGSSLWFLTVGIILLGSAAIAFLARRTSDHEYARQTLAPEPSRVPVVLTGLGVLFLAMLVLPNFAGGDSTPSSPATSVQQQEPAQGQVSETAGISEAPVQNAPRRVVPQDSFTTAPATTQSQTYVVQEGDTLWDIALQHDVSVAAIVEANDLEDETAISIDQELIIPAVGTADAGSAAADGTETQP